MMWTRRHLLSLAPGALLLPRPLLAAPAGTSDRKLLVIYAYGGWDTTRVFTPMMENPYVSSEPDAVAAEASGLQFVDHAERPSVRAFFEDFGDRSCVINGMEVRSVTHERCQRLLFTGGSGTRADDFAVLAASNTQGTYAAPHLVIAGPAFTGNYAANVVRAGEVGQLSDLLDGTAFEKLELVVEPPSHDGEALEIAALQARLERYAAVAPRGSAARVTQRYQEAFENLSLLQGRAGDINLKPLSTGCRRDIAQDAACAFNAFEVGLSRCAITRDDGWCSTTWDTHTGNSDQSMHFEELFAYLHTLMLDLDTRTSASGGSLADEVTIAVISEMGRSPLEQNGGKGHWTFTSAMLIGAGVQGGQVIGAMDEEFSGSPVQLETGEVSSNGTSLLPAHLGATILEILGLDYGEYLAQGEPIRAAIDG